MPEGRPCTSTNLDGSPCKAYALTDSDLCWAHDPRLEDKRDFARKNGGRYPELIAGIPTKIAKIDDVLSLISEVVYNLRNLPISINQAKALLSACQTAMQAIEYFNMEERITALEERILANEEQNA
jgi:hypothetical protein